MIYFILLISFLLRIISLNQSLWLDEATSALVVKNLSFFDIVGKFSPGDFHPPLYYLFLKAWTNIFSYSEMSLRSPSIIFGVLTVYIIYLVGKEIFNKKVGIISSLFLATSSLHIYYSQEARMYSMATFLVILSVYLYLKLLKKITYRNLFLFSVSITAAVFTEYLTVFMFLVFFIWPLFDKRKSEWWRKFVISLLFPGILGLLWLPVFIKQLFVGMHVGESLPNWWNILGVSNFRNITLIPIKFMLGRVDVDANLFYGVIISFLCVLYFFIINKSKNSTFLWVWLMTPILLMVIMGVFVPVVYYFRILFVLPAFFLLLASGINQQKDKIHFVLTSLILIVNLFTSFLYLTNKAFQREDWMGLTRYIEANKTGSGVIVFPSNANKEAYFYYVPNAKIAAPGEDLSKYDQIWIMSYLEDIFDPDKKYRSKVEELNYTLKDERSFNGIGIVSLYTK